MSSKRAARQLTASGTAGVIRLSCLLGCAGISIAASQAQAQTALGSFLDSAIPIDIDRGRQTSVQDRPRPEYEPDGAPLGPFTILPSLQLGVGASNNVFGASTSKTSDVFFTIDPQVRARSNWSRHSLVLSAGGAFRRFGSQTVRNEDGLFATIDGRFDASRSVTILASARAERAYQSQYASDAPNNTLTPIQYAKYNALIRAVYAAGRIKLTGALDANKLNFQNVTSVSGAVVDQNFRDRTVTRAATKLEYAFTPEFAAFGEASVSNINHSRDLIGTAPNRDGTNTQVLAGTSFDLAGIARAQLGIGYIRRTFAANTYKVMDGVGYDARAEFFPSGLTTVTLGIKRSIEEAASTGSSGYFARMLTVRVDHELMRNVILFVEADHQHSRFQGIDRRDQTVQAQGGALYLMNQNFRVSAAVIYSDRSSKGAAAGPGFDDLRGVIAITGAL